MGRSRIRGTSPIYLNPPPREVSPPSSVLGDWDASTAMPTSRPPSLAILRTSSPVSKTPCLSEILSNQASPPWTLSAFTAYLSQNHCLETLEFLMEAERYRAAYAQNHLTHEPSPNRAQGLDEGCEDVCSLWQQMMEVYITPYGAREVNLPGPVRDRLLKLNSTASNPPDPSELDEAVQIVHELISDSVLVPFLESVAPTVIDSHAEEDSNELKQSRTRLRIPKDLMSPQEENSQSPKTSFLPLLGLGRSNAPSTRSALASVSSHEHGEGDLVTDDSSLNSTPGAEPMTPPTTPPSTEFTFGTSPNTLQRAVSGNSWKKMSAKLGLSRKHKSTHRSQPTNVPHSSQEDMFVTTRQNAEAPL